MPAPLTLHLTDYSDDAHWRWALHDANDRFLTSTAPSACPRRN